MAFQQNPPIPVRAVPIVRNQTQNQVLGDRDLTLDIGWCEKNQVGRVLISISKRDDAEAERRMELFCREKDEEQWLFCDLTSSPDPMPADSATVRSYLLEKYNLDVDWNGSFWEGEYPF